MTTTLDLPDRFLPRHSTREARPGDDVSVLLNARIVEPSYGTGGCLSDVWLHAGQIKRVVPAGSEPATGNILELNGRYLAPGLMDTHVHLAFDAGDDPIANYNRSTDEQIVEQVVKNARIALRAGTTTVRDCGTPKHLLGRIRAALGMLSDTATVVHCGAPICRVGGHGHSMGGEVRSREDVESIIAEQHAAGATWVKLMASGGGMTPGTNPADFDFDPSLLREAVVIAEYYGMRAAAHAHASAAMAACIEAGVHSLEHASMLGPDGRITPDRDLLHRVADAGIRIVPTVVAARIVAQRLREGHRVVNPKDRNAVARLESRFTNLAEFALTDVPLVAGTDAGPAHVGFDLMARELDIYVEAGLTAQQALQSATCDAADMLGLGWETGQILPGMWADFIVTAENPIDDIKTLGAPVGVIKRGRLIITNMDARRK